MASADAERDDLRQQCLAALCYFDLFSYPLTTEEVRRFRYCQHGGGWRSGDGSRVAARPVGAQEVRDALKRLPVSESRGFWFLSGRPAPVAERERRYRLAEPKFRRARRVAFLLGLLPSVRLAAVCNSLAWTHAHEDSDIDLFVVVRPGTIWVTRFLVAATLQLLGLRPDGRTQADRICLSFLVTEDYLDLARLALEPDDPYLRYWISSLVPLYDAGGVFEAFLAANRWVVDRLPGFAAPQAGHRRRVRSWPFVPLMPPMRRLEGLARRWQLRHFPDSIRRTANLSSDVVVSDDILKFHVRDERRRIAREFEEKLHEVNGP